MRTAWARTARRCAVVVALLACGNAVGAANAADPAGVPAAQSAASGVRPQQVLGNWLTQDRDGIIQISQASDGSYQGRIVGGDDPGRLDTTNPDPARRHEPLLGQIIMQGMKYLGAGHWSTGTIRDPNNGHVYKCRLQLLGADRLQIRGFLGISLLGRSQVWTRYTGTSMTLPPAR